ncbi:ABC transporter ATP-binding protein [Lactococcus petauri]|uniref:ABC transporter ATP-binding protein n=1 Tax=Lactococcus petauri TaxID=1940789 RepID=UPI0038538245
MKTIVNAHRVGKYYEEKTNRYTVLHEVDLVVEEGEFIAIMGPSGAGKSTLLNILSTIDKPSTGEVSIDGKDIIAMNEKELSTFRRDSLGFIFQDYNLLDTLTVRDNIALPLALAKYELEDIDNLVDKISKRFGISQILEKYPYQISGGQKQRTASARAIVSNPSLILADEPTGALDSKSATDLLEKLEELSSGDNATILMVTHDAFAASYSERVIFIKDGVLFKEIKKETNTRKVFFQKILEVLSKINEGDSNVI